jgi:DNA polymerase IV (archaeal DinB-like DNA polymerase)
MQERIIMLLDMDAFFAEIEERESPQFQGKPVVVGADPQEGKGRGVVSTCNYKARKFGIHSAMPISQAYHLCPQAVFLPVNMALYSRVSERVMKIIQKVCKGCLVEQVFLDEAYIDFVLFPTIVKNKTKEKENAWRGAEMLAKKLTMDILEQEKLTCSIGIGSNKMVAKIACQAAKPNGIKVVEPKDTISFLSPLHIREIPGIGPKADIKLQDFFKTNAVSIEKLREASKQDLISLFGVIGNSIYEKARGRDTVLVTPEHEIKSIGKEHTFFKDTRDPEELLAVFEDLLCEVQDEIHKSKLQFRTITVVCRFQGFTTYTKSKTVDKNLFTELFFKEAKKLLLRFVVEQLKPVRLIGVRVKV